MTEQNMDLSHQDVQPLDNNQQSHAEKMLTNEEVNRIAAAKKNEGYSKGYKDALAQFQQQPQQVPQQNYGQSVGGIQQLSPEDVQKMIAEHHQNLLMQQQQAQRDMEANRLAQTYFQKLQNSKEKYPDFEQVVGSLKYDSPHMAQIVHMATNLDNTGDVMYELRKNPEKLANLVVLTQIDPDVARQKLLDLSNSIKQNESAKNIQMPDEPLSQHKPSNVGSGNGKPSLRDLKAIYRA